MARDPMKTRPGKGRPEIWASGGQRPPFDLRALGRASLFLSREAMARCHAWAARTGRRAAVNVKNGAGRIPAEKLGRVARFVPSHLRVAGWIKTLAAILSHAGATADPDVPRGNALVAEIAPHLWDEAALVKPTPPTEDVAPVVLAEPPPVLHAGDDPLALIRDAMATAPDGAKASQPTPALPPAPPPAPPGPVAETAIQVFGYLIGWASVGLALPYGFARSLWMWLNGRDLKTIGRDD